MCAVLQNGVPDGGCLEEQDNHEGVEERGPLARETSWAWELLPLDDCRLNLMEEPLQPFACSSALRSTADSWDLQDFTAEFGIQAFVPTKNASPLTFKNSVLFCEVCLTQLD